jgi:hypothetical protein
VGNKDIVERVQLKFGKFYYKIVKTSRLSTDISDNEHTTT